MPMYDYYCEKCSKLWEENLPMSKRNLPCKSPCPICKEDGGVKKNITGFPGVNVDTTLTPDKATGGKWSEITNKIKSGLPERYAKNIKDDMSGHRWK